MISGLALDTRVKLYKCIPPSIGPDDVTRGGCRKNRHAHSFIFIHMIHAPANQSTQDLSAGVDRLTSDHGFSRAPSRPSRFGNSCLIGDHGLILAVCYSNSNTYIGLSEFRGSEM